MTIRKWRAVALAVCLLGTSAFALSVPAAGQMAVVDNANLAQNILEAARALQQINNQIRSLQNEATMIENMGRNLQSLNTSQLGGMTSDLGQIGTLMNQAQGIGFNVNAVTTTYQKLYPQQYDTNTPIPQLTSDAESRWQNARNAYQQTMLVQSQIAQTAQSDTTKLAALVTASQGASGNLQVSQATNQLLALAIKQQLQIETLLAAQGRADALNGANKSESEEQGRVALQTFLGTSNAYTP